MTRKNNHKSMRVIELTKGYVAIIDKEDFRRVNKYTWRVSFSGRKPAQPYARTSIKGKGIYLHRFLMNPESNMHVDHLNHCTLDNRKSNLEVVCPLTNNRRRRCVQKKEKILNSI